MSSSSIEEVNKFEILKIAFLAEKEKSKNLELNIKNLKKYLSNIEDELETKNKELTKIIIERNNLSNKIDLNIINSNSHENYDNEDPNKKSLLISKDSQENMFMHFSSHDNDEFNYEEFSKLEYQNQNLKKQLLEINENFIILKDELQSIIKSQNNKIITLENELKNLNEEHLKYVQSTHNIMKQNNNYEIKLHNSESINIKLNDDLSKNHITIQNMRKEIQEKDNLMLKFQESMLKFENENNLLKVKLTQLKTAIIDENTKEKTFSGFRKDLFNKTNINLTFTKSEDGYYVLVISDSKNEEIILINDILEFKINYSQIDNFIELQYNSFKSKIKSTIIHMNENVIEIAKIYNYFKEKTREQEEFILN